MKYNEFVLNENVKSKTDDRFEMFQSKFLTSLLVLNNCIDVAVKAKETLRKAKQTYETVESELIHRAQENAMGKNAEARKAEVEHIICMERTAHGELCEAWTDLQTALDESTRADAELEKAKNDFTYQQVIAKLIANC